MKNIVLLIISLIIGVFSSAIAQSFNNSNFNPNNSIYQITDKSKKLEEQKILGNSTSKNDKKDINRLINVKLACKKINNFVLAPNKIFSFNQVVGIRTPENGFKKADVITGDNKWGKDYGGGICQVSSTLYNAVLEGNLQVIERHPHTLKVSYYPIGRDAMVDWGTADFKFQNNTKNYLIIKSQAFDDGTVTVEIIKDN